MTDFEKVKAVDLSLYAYASFDAVLLLGPLYHLTSETERLSCIKEVKSNIPRPLNR